jgi:hypothetical protein
MITNHIFQVFDISATFPGVKEFNLSFDKDRHGLFNLAHLENLTSFTGNPGINPMSFLRLMPRAINVRLSVNDYHSVHVDPFELPSLKSLEIDSKQLWTMSEIQAVFTSFTNMEKLDLSVGGLADDFNEKVT